MNLHQFSRAVLALVCVLLFTRCEKDNNNPVRGTFSKGVFIVNEGNFGHGNASVSFFNRDSLKATNELFIRVNDRPLGDVAQSMAEYNGKYYIVVNASDKVEVVDKNNFVSAGVINNLSLPRYFLGISLNKAYVTQWGDGYTGAVAVVDLSSNTVLKTIPTGKGAEKLLALNDLVYVANSGGYGDDSTVAVINANSDELLTKIKVGYNPTSLAIDRNNKLWVLCGGKWKSDYSGLEKPGSLVKVNLSTNQVESSFPFSSLNGGYNRQCLFLNKDRNIIFYTLDGQLYSQNTDNTTLSATPVISRVFYSVGLDIQGSLFYAADTRNGTTDGWIIRYNTNYAKVDSFEVGILPDEMLFN